MAVSGLIEANLPFLRRYARAIAGETALGDHYVEMVLEEMLGESEPRSSKPDLFRRLDQKLSNINVEGLNSPPRRAMLLTAMEEFSVDDTSSILGINRDQVLEYLKAAERDLSKELTARIMIMEDEPLIAAHLKRIVQSLGHVVVGHAMTKDTAVALYNREQPDLVLADVRLADDSLGTDAVKEMNISDLSKVIFITAYPEILFADKGVGPSYLITKPFQAEYVKAVISQARLATKQKSG